MPGTKLWMPLPGHSPDGAQTAGHCVCLTCWGNSEVAACPSSPPSGRKTPLDCGSEAWPRPGLCPRRGNGAAPTPCPGKQPCHPAVPVLPWLVAGAWPPGAAEGHVTGRVHHGRPAALRSVCRAARLRPTCFDSRTGSLSFAWNKDLGLFSAEMSSGVRPGHHHPSTLLRQTHGPPHAVLCEHSACTPEPQLFHLGSLGMKLELKQRQKGHYE